MRIRATRRDFLHVGFAGGIGLTLADFFRMKKAQADIKQYESTEGTAKSVIFIYLPGGAAHQETWDPKPYAPIEYRGPMSPIDTNVPGEQINQMLKQTAQVADKIMLLARTRRCCCVCSSSATCLSCTHHPSNHWLKDQNVRDNCSTRKDSNVLHRIFAFERFLLIFTTCV